MFVTVGAIYFPCAVYGQFTDPRTYANAPVGVNQLELDYGHATADDSIDTSLVIGGSHLEVNEVPVAYIRTFGIMHHLAWVKAIVPFAYISGSVAGSGLSRSVAGAGDASLQLTTLLLGGSALAAEPSRSPRMWGAATGDRFVGSTGGFFMVVVARPGARASPAG